MLRFLLAVFSLICSAQLSAQDISHLRHKGKLLKGSWQLTKTINHDTPHAIAKEEYDGVITFRCLHRYQEEVIYEGYHWIIRGRWKVNRKSANLDLTKLEYVSGAPPGGQLQDIQFILYRLDKTHWAGDTETKAEKVKMEYERILPVKKAAKAH